MAPLGSPVHSPEYGRAAVVSPLRSSHASTSQAFHSSPKPSPVHERTPPYFSWLLAELDKGAAHSTNTDRHKLQYTNSDTPYCSPQNTVPASGNYVVQLCVGITSPTYLSIKTEPDWDSNACPLFKSLSSPNSPTAQVPKSAHDVEFGIKAEPDPISQPGPEPIGAADRKVSSEGVGAVPDLFPIGKSQDDGVCPEIDDTQPCHKVKDTDLSDRCQTQTEAPSTESNSTCNTQGATSPSSVAVVEPSLNQQEITAPSKSALYYLIRRLLKAVVHRPAAHPAASSPQPPDDGEHELPNHEAAPQSSRLYKSLYGLAQCLRSQVDTTSLNSGDTSNTPVFNQAGFNGDSASASNTTGMANNSANNSGHYANLDVQEVIGAIGIDNLDPEFLRGLSVLSYTLARHVEEGRAVGRATHHGHIPNLSHPSLNPPVPLFTPDFGGGSPATHFVPTPGSHIRPPPHSSASYSSRSGQGEQISLGPSASQPPTDNLHSGEGPLGHPYGYSHAFPNNTIPEQSVPSFQDGHGANGVGTSSYNIGQQTHIFLTTTPSAFADANQMPGPDSKTCHLCGREFSRSKQLRDHMYQHTGIKGKSNHSYQT